MEFSYLIVQKTYSTVCGTFECSSPPRTDRKMENTNIGGMTYPKMLEPCLSFLLSLWEKEKQLKSLICACLKTGYLPAILALSLGNDVKHRKISQFFHRFPLNPPKIFRSQHVWSMSEAEFDFYDPWSKKAEALPLVEEVQHHRPGAHGPAKQDSPQLPVPENPQEPGVITPKTKRRNEVLRSKKIEVS